MTLIYAQMIPTVLVCGSSPRPSALYQLCMVPSCGGVPDVHVMNKTLEACLSFFSAGVPGCFGPADG